jgi:hypothetical protein
MSYRRPCHIAIVTTTAQEDDLQPESPVLVYHITGCDYECVFEMTAAWPGCKAVRRHVDDDSNSCQSVSVLRLPGRISPILNSYFQFSSSGVGHGGSIIRQNGYGQNSWTSFTEEGSVFSSLPLPDTLLGHLDLLWKDTGGSFQLERQNDHRLLSSAEITQRFIPASMAWCLRGGDLP